MYDIPDAETFELSDAEEAIWTAVDRAEVPIDSTIIYATCAKLFEDRAGCIAAIARMRKAGWLKVIEDGGRPRYLAVPGNQVRLAAEQSMSATDNEDQIPIGDNAEAAAEPEPIPEEPADEPAFTGGILTMSLGQILGDAVEPAIVENISPPPASEAAQPIPEEHDTGRTATPVIIGHGGDDEVAIDLARLLASRLLITAASGGGKSWAIRRLLEQTADQVQQLIIDPEGEFATLTEKYPYVVCNASDSEIRLRAGGANALAKLFMRNRLSAVLDISELDPDDRHLFVRNFINGLMALPQDEWHHAMIVIDEAHLFAPQHDKSDAKKAVIDLAGRGRKRGLCPVLATQRLSKLNKNVAAELQNRLIGQTILDVDIRRAADELGITVAEAASMLPELGPGEFFVYGPAICRRVRKIRVGDVTTSHGAQLATIQPPALGTDELISSIASQVNRKPSAAEAEDSEEEGGESEGLNADAGETARPNSVNEDQLRVRIAEARYEFIKAAIAAPRGKLSREIAAAAARAGVSAATIQSWLRAYQRNQTIDALRPKRLGAASLQLLERRQPTSETESVPATASQDNPQPIRSRPLEDALRLRLTHRGLGAKHLQILEYLRSGAVAADIARVLQMQEQEVQSCETLMCLLLSAQNTAQLLIRIEEIARTMERK